MEIGSEIRDLLKYSIFVQVARSAWAAVDSLAVISVRDSVGGLMTSAIDNLDLDPVNGPLGWELYDGNR